MAAPAFVAYDNMAFLGCDVAGKTLGVVGMGSIGGEVARRALGFKMETLYFNRTRRPEAVERELGATWVPRLEDLLPRCDFVVVVCPLTPATAGLLGAKTLPLMRDGSVLVWKPNIQSDFNVSVFECFDASSSVVLQELDESDRFVPKSAESTSN